MRTGLLVRLFGETTHRDGEAAMLEAHAGELGETEALPIGRTQRQLPLPHEVVVETLAEKILHAWLQNRHQTLYPLTVNLRALDAEHAALLARMMAFAMLTGTAAPGEDRIEEGLRWLAQVGGDGEVASAFRMALDAPDPLRVLLRTVQSAGLTAYAYVVSIVATDPRNEAGQLFLDYLAVRLALPKTVVRSADRRYRGYASASVRVVSAP